MNTVWIVNYAGHDYSPAKSFGELEFITRGYVSRGSVDRFNSIVAESIAQTHPDDWLLPSGLMPLNVLAGTFWFVKHGELRLLIHDQKEDDYRPLVLSEEQARDLLEVQGHERATQSDG